MATKRLDGMKLVKIALILLLLALQIKLWFGGTGVFQHGQTKQRIETMQTDNARLAQINRQLAEQTQDLKQSDDALELKARSELGFVKQGEHYFYFQD